MLFCIIARAIIVSIRVESSTDTAMSSIHVSKPNWPHGESGDGELRASQGVGHRR